MTIFRHYLMTPDICTGSKCPASVNAGVTDCYHALAKWRCQISEGGELSLSELCQIYSIDGVAVGVLRSLI